MARIILLSRSIQHTTWPLALSLKSQQHDVHLITDRNSELENSNDLNVMTYFSRWNVWEALRFVPHLLSLNPQIFHIVLEQNKMSSAELILSLVAASIPHCIVTTSLLDSDIKFRKNSWVKSLVERSDIVTCPSMEALGNLRGLNIQNRRQNRGLMPPLLSTPKEAVDPSEGLENIKVQLKKKPSIAVPFILEPSGLSKNMKAWLSVISKKYHVVFLGNWENWSVRSRKKITRELDEITSGWSLSASTNHFESEYLLSACKALWLAGLPLSPTAYSQNLWMSWQTQTPLIIDTIQASMHSGLWKDELNCHIIHDDPSELVQETERLMKKSLETPEKLNIQTTRDLMDHSTNDLNRLYNKALSEKAHS